MNKKILMIAAVALLALIAIPTFAILAVKPKPKIVVYLELPLSSLGTSENKIHGDKVVFTNGTWEEAEEGARLLIFQWVPEPPDPNPMGHTHVEAITGPGWPLTHNYTGGTLLATAHGIRDRYTRAGTWHMEFTVTFDIEGVDSGFHFKHTCEGVAWVHTATWSGSGFGAFEGVKVSGISIADLLDPPVTKKAWGEVTSGYDNLPPWTES